MVRKVLETVKTWTFEEVRPPKGGPWDNEPDKAHWVDPKTNLDCLIVRNGAGALCGYVGVPPGHRWHGTFYGDIELAIGVHGGLTFSEFCQAGAGDGYGICHVPLPGREPNVWWLGFDCHHFMDLGPTLEVRMASLGVQPPYSPRVYRTFDYVKAEVESLARQCL